MAFLSLSSLTAIALLAPVAASGAEVGAKAGALAGLLWGPGLMIDASCTGFCADCHYSVTSMSSLTHTGYSVPVM